MSTTENAPSVVVVGGGFAGVGCARELGKHGVAVTLLDQHNYHQFQPLLYQVATAELAIADIARPLRGIFTTTDTVDVKQATVTAVDPDAPTVTTAGGQTFSADYLVLAAGSRAELLPHAGRRGARRSRSTRSTDAKAAAQPADRGLRGRRRRPTRIDEGALNIVIVGGGPTGVETAGAVADLVNEVMPQGATTTWTSSGRGSTWSTTAGRARRLLRQGPRLRRRAS